MSAVRMTLRKISSELGIPKSTLSYYADPKGLRLLKPVQEIPESKLKLYDINEVKQTLKRITSMQQRGYTLKDIAQKL